MLFHELPMPGAYVIEPERIEDERGFFARWFCEKEFAARGLNTAWPQCNTSFNVHAGTLRGMHYQAAPHEEVKLILCARGAVHDVLLDLRPDSPAYLRSHGFELSAENHLLVYVPRGVAHGFLTLADVTEVLYLMGMPYVPESNTGVRWNDPAFKIQWPGPVRLISPKDASFPDYVHPAGIQIAAGATTP
ncbi:MAG: dTDP-4-dehydrorhamnose 3,5-epimerase family protein [Candidatus Hydrogenedentes bacterium]|nr:dTDP-4-dehydrorhamnose 3,5-epimerase family protein [Candidatus Hydrogenedentota bacterium]